ncbi:MAG: PD-(D/E)XK nuclease family protein [Deltaproteobacteria bacterium]|nr:PD-(D/E)XK nuclease family protein [Deltaproteobacteria bacterium]
MPQQRVFVGDSFAVLQQALVTAVQTVKKVDPLVPITVIAPSTPLAVRLRREIAWAGSGHFGVHVCTLTDFAREAAEDVLLSEGSRPLPLLAAPLLVKRFLEEAGQDNYFAPLAALPGFPRTLLATLTDLLHADVSPLHLRDFLAQAPQAASARRKLASLAVLYELYLAFLAERKFYDDAILMKRASVQLATETQSAPLFVYGFYDFTPLQRQLIAAATNRRDTLVFFPWRAGEAYAHTLPTLTWLTNLGFQRIPLVAAPEPERNLARLQARIFEERVSVRARPATKTDPSVLILSAPGEQQEAREIGRLILEFVRTHGVRFHEFGVLLRDPGSYGQLFVETLAGLGIRCFLHGGLPLLQTVAGKQLVLLCHVLLEDYARARVFEFLSVADPPFATLLGGLAEAARPASWETFSVQAGIVKGAHVWRDRLSRLLHEQPTEEEFEKRAQPDRHALQAFSVFMDGFLAVSKPRPAVDSWRGWARFMTDLLHRYASPTSDTSRIEEVLLGLSELDLVSGPVSLAEWVKGVTTALTTATVPVGVMDRDGVFVGDLLAARGLQFRVAIVPGLIDGVFPRLTRQDPLLLDEERQYVAEFLSVELRQRRGLSEAEQLLFVFAVHSAREWLVLSYPRAEHGGGLARTPSFYLLRAIEAMSDEPTSFAELRTWERRASFLPAALGPMNEAVDPIEYHLLSAGQALASGDPTTLGYLPAVAPFFSSALHAVGQRWNGDRLTPFEGMIEAEAVRAQVQRDLFPTGLRLSASALETYARCPFRYFLQSLLGLSEAEDPELILTLRPRERGALLHDILQDFFTRADAAGWTPLARADKSAARALLQHVVEEQCRRFALLNVTGFSLLWELEQERLLDRLFSFLEREYESGEDFLPAAFEVQFGVETPAPEADTASVLFPNGPVRFTLDDGVEIALRGRIDRIDLAPDRQRARIVDYKTGKTFRGRFAGGTALQLPLYVYAARKLWPERVWESASYTYVSRERRAETPTFTKESWATDLLTLREVVTKLTGSLRAGCFAATPDECAPCPFPLICHSNNERRAERKHGDRRLDLLRQVRGVE